MPHRADELSLLQAQMVYKKKLDAVMQELKSQEAQLLLKVSRLEEIKSVEQKDLDRLDSDGLPAKEYTPHLGAPLYPDLTLPKPAAKEKLRQQNEAFCREVYERVYGMKLEYE